MYLKHDFFYKKNRIIRGAPTSYGLVYHIFSIISIGRQNSNIYMYIYYKNKFGGKNKGRGPKNYIACTIVLHNSFNNKFDNCIVGKLLLILI